MKINLLIAATDIDYVEHLSRVLSEKYSSTFQVGVCSSAELLADMLAANRYDAALLDPALASSASLSTVQLPLLLVDESMSISESESVIEGSGIGGGGIGGGGSGGGIGGGVPSANSVGAGGGTGGGGGTGSAGGTGGGTGGGSGTGGAGGGSGTGGAGGGGGTGGGNGGASGFGGGTGGGASGFGASAFGGFGFGGYGKILKYQRISSIASNILELYADVSKSKGGFMSSKAQITAVWSPSGGSGKTTAALAYAAYKSSMNRKVVYLNLEHFASTSVYFKEEGKSISKVFEKLESNVQMLLAAIRQQDSGSGIMYFNEPDNYDDMNVLTPENIATLIIACATEMDDLVVDLPSQCDDRVAKAFDLADAVMLVCDPTKASQAKMRQFIAQHNVFGQLGTKAVLVNNKGAAMSEPRVGKAVQLPLVQSADPVSVYKTLSSGNFDW